MLKNWLKHRMWRGRSWAWVRPAVASCVGDWGSRHFFACFFTSESLTHFHHFTRWQMKDKRSDGEPSFHTNCWRTYFSHRLGKDPKSTHWRNLPPRLHLVGLTGTKANPGCTSAHWSLGIFLLITRICPNFIIMFLCKWKFSLARVTERLNNTHRSYFFWSDVFVLILKYSFHQFQMYLSDRYDHQQVHIGHWPACHVSSYLRVYSYSVISHRPTQPQPIYQYFNWLHLPSNGIDQLFWDTLLRTARSQLKI